MIHPIRPFRVTLLTALLCGASAVSLLAQGPGGPPPGDDRRPYHGPPPSPLFDALDTNHDGVISAEEMANATAALKSLLKPGSNELRREDVRPLPPPHHPGNDDPAANEDEHPHPRPAAMHPHNPPPPADQAPAEKGDQAAPTANDAAGKPAPLADGGEHRPHHGPPPNPLFDALDTNHDGILSAEEMGKATDSLKALLKGDATQIKREDLRPAHPPQHPPSAD